MLKAIKNNQLIYSWDTEKNEKPFFCPECKKELGLRKGNIKIHHFYHIRKFDCISNIESQIHLEIKFKLYKYLKTIYDFVDIEYRIKDRIADVFYINRKNNKIVYEIQKSKLTVDNIKERTNSYKDNNVYVIWLLIKDHIKINSDNKEIKLSQWQMYIYNLYKKLYVYDKGIIYEYYLENVIRDYENYDEYGNHYYSSNRLKTIKRIKEIKINTILDKNNTK